jgi:MICOS complex subunit MIC60
VINSIKRTPDAIQRFVYEQFGYGQGLSKPQEVPEEPSQTVKSVISDSRERISRAGQRLKTTVKKTESATKEDSTNTEVAKRRAIQFSAGVEELVRKAEKALGDKPGDSLPEAMTTSSQPAALPSSNQVGEMAGARGSDIYDVPLPLGFEPPPGYSRPSPPPEAMRQVVETAAVPPSTSLPLMAPSISELGASEPIITHLASTIDNLAVFLKDNPAAAEKATGVLEIARTDLTSLASRMEKVREDEQLQLEQKLDDQAREYSIRLLELEMAAQDKLDNQEDDFRKLFDEERVKLTKAYREKLDHELQIQSELINER